MADLSSLGWLQGASSLLQAFGMLQGGAAARIAGQRARVSAEFNQRQSEREAGLAIALGQHQALEERRQSSFVASRALAVAAASGAGVTDPTVVRLIASARGEGAYRASVALYEGEARARQLRMQGVIGLASGYEAEAEGAARQMGAIFWAAGAAAKGGLSLYAKYGMNGPGAKGDANLILDAGSTSLAGDLA